MSSTFRRSEWVRLASELGDVLGRGAGECEFDPEKGLVALAGDLRDRVATLEAELSAQRERTQASQNEVEYQIGLVAVFESEVSLWKGKALAAQHALELEKAAPIMIGGFTGGPD